MKQMELTTEEKMMLYDLVSCETWQLVKKIVDLNYQNCLEQLLSMSESGDFRHIQGLAHGYKYFVAAIEQLARPQSVAFEPIISEDSLNARING
jgi:hypothetical protein